MFLLKDKKTNKWITATGLTDEIFYALPFKTLERAEIYQKDCFL